MKADIYSDINKKINDGSNLEKGFLILRWDNWAQNIKKAIDIEPKRTKSLYQIPANSKTDDEILKAPTKFLSRSEYPNSLNSFTTLSYLKVQTKNTDTATINWKATESSNIYFIFFNTNVG